MDYHSIHGRDISSFDLPSTHRLPTVSAAQALEDISNDPRRFIPTGIRALDKALASVRDADSDGPPRLGGFQRGQVIEIWGPPGSGKTTLGMQLATNTLNSGGKVVWIDGFHTTCGQRLHDLMSASQGALSPTPDQPQEAPCSDHFLHFTAPSLAHLIALLCKPTSSSIPPGTQLVVVDSLSALFNHALPKTYEPRQASKGPQPSNRRLQVFQYLISALQKLAAARDTLIVISSQCATRMQAERGATLVPALSSNAWEQGVGSRIVLFRNWARQQGDIQSVYFAGIQKLDGRLMPDAIGPVFAFNIQQGGMMEVDIDDSQSSMVLLSASHHKRKLGQTDFELPDSQDEDYGWEDDDAAAIPTVPQWQGSEDILLGSVEDGGGQSDGDSDCHPRDPDVSPR